MNHHYNKKFITISVLILVFLLSNPFTWNANSATISFGTANSIKTINNIVVSINQNTLYKLPKTVVAIMVNNAKKSVAIKWNVKSTTINTQKLGTQYFYGNVVGYSKQVKLVVKVLAAASGKQIKLISAKAENGRIIVKLSNKPSATLNSNKFSLTYRTSNHSEKTLKVTNISIDPSGLVYTISFEKILPEPIDKAIILMISFDHSKIVSNQFIIPASKEIIINNRNQFYAIIQNSLQNFEKTVEMKIKSYNKDLYNLDVVDKVIYENPSIDYAYYGCSAHISSENADGLTSYTLKLDYLLSKEEMVRQKAVVENKVKEIIKEHIKSNMTDYQKELILHDYIVSTSNYDELVFDGSEPVESHNAYGVLYLGIGVCESYAKALSLLLREAGLEEMYVIGDAQNNNGTVPHAWNMVKLDGEWYHVDSTWDDPTFSDGTTLVKHDYFNVNDSTIKKDHIVDKSLTDYPESTGSKYNFFHMKSIEYDSKGNPMSYIYSETEFLQAILKAISEKRAGIGFILINCITQNYDAEDALNKVYDQSGNFSAGMIATKNPIDSNISYIEFEFSYK